MNSKLLLHGTVFAIAAMLASTAHAAIIQWTLENVLFDDGGALSGTFSTDSSSGDVLSFNLTSTAGSTLSGFNYNSSDSTYINLNGLFPNSLQIVNNSPWAMPQLFLTFNSALASYGTDALVTSSSWECMNCNPYRLVESGYAIGAPVPEPETYAMMLAGLGLVGVMARRRKQNFAV